MKSATIFADFNNCDADGCVRLNTAGTLEDLDRHDIQLAEGMRLDISDGDLEATIVVRTPGAEEVWRGEIVSGPVDVGTHRPR